MGDFLTEESASRQAAETASIRDLLRSPPLWIALAAGLILRLFLILWTPVGGDAEPGKLSSYNDEIAHAKYVHYVLHYRTLPSHEESIQEPGALQRGLYEYYQPPLYYVFVAMVADTLDCRELTRIVLLGRVLNSLLFIALLWLFIWLSRALHQTALETTSGMMFLSLSGVLVRFTSIATNDALFWLLVGGVFISLIHLSRNPKSLWSLCAFSCLTAAALYTKLTALFVLPLLVVSVWQRLSRDVLWKISGTFALIALITLPIWNRNILMFGSWLPLTSGFGESAWRIPGLDFLSYAARSFLFPWSEYWGGLIGLPLLLVPTVFFISRILVARSWKILYTYRVFIWSGLLIMCAFLWLNMRYDQAEARYLFAAWPALSLLLATSIRTRNQQWFFLSALLVPYLLFCLPVFGGQLA